VRVGAEAGSPLPGPRAPALRGSSSAAEALVGDVARDQRASDRDR
jgi:hypothetical protein